MIETRPGTQVEVAIEALVEQETAQAGAGAGAATDSTAPVAVQVRNYLRELWVIAFPEVEWGGVKSEKWQGSSCR